MPTKNHKNVLAFGYLRGQNMEAGRILEGLNDAQRNAVTSEASILQILAPPGSGKTKTLTSRVSWFLFHQGYKPWNVICLTFTIKSAREMKERIARQIGGELGTKLILGTFHSVCLRYLRSYGHFIGLSKGFDIADSSDSQAIIKRIIKQKKLIIDPSIARSRISYNKAKNKSYLDCQRDQRKSVEQQEFVIIYETYQTYLSTAKLLDYDDLLVRCAELLRNHPQCISNIEAVLIDEFQDTNHIQFDLMQLFAAQCQRITTVGDPDQSIYGWRSAEIENLNKMQRIYPDNLVLNLESNYRSSPTILQAAQMVIEQDESRPQKTMIATHYGGTLPVLRRLFNPKTQAGWIVNEIRRSRAATGHQLLEYSDYAILIRSASLSRQIESSLASSGVPYRMVGGLRFFDRKEIKILLDYMRVARHPENNDAIARIINYPARGIGEKSIKMIQDKATSTNRLWWSVVVDEMGRKKSIGLKDSVLKGLKSFFNIINTCNEAMMDEKNPVFPLELLELFIEKLNFEKHLKKEYPEDHEQRLANVEELKVQASEYSSSDRVDEFLPELDDVEQMKGNPAQEALTKFLGNIALSTELQSEKELDDEGNPLPKVTISTIHAAKGLEWPVVFIPCVYKGSIPHSRAEDEDEERRLLYVAMTRAQALLYMTVPVQGQMSEAYTLCPFLDESDVLGCLAERAPSIYYQVNIISSILRRQCPSMETCQEAMNTLSYIDDDEITWPLDGSKGIGNDGSTQFWNAENVAVESASGFLNKGANLERSERGNEQISMTQTGFITATSQLKHQLPEVTLQTSPTAGPASKRLRVTKNPSNQATIGTFFGKTNFKSTSQQEIELPRSTHVLHRPQVKLTNQFGLSRPFTRPEFLPGPRIKLAKSRAPLRSISSDLANHRVSRGFGLQRQKTSMDQYHTGRSLSLLLSSSPSKSDSVKDLISEPVSETINIANQSTVMTQRTPMETFQYKSSVSRRNLGLARTSKPWASNSGAGFSIPKISRP